MEALEDVLPTLIADGRRVLIFSQFTGLLDEVSRRCAGLRLEHRQLTGKTKNRQQLIDGFQNNDFPLFLISLKAGGTGLTLTAADTVIHLDPWWNPAVEDQATDRVHRIGQDKPVFVYRLLCEGTVEERIRSLQNRKRELMAALYDDQGGANARFSAEDIDELLRPLDES